MKKLAVDVEKSLKYKANGRLKAADKKEFANLSKKKFACVDCGDEPVDVEYISFGQVYTCAKCGGEVLEVID
jgi:transcription elongation factor Elf1